MIISVVNFKDLEDVRNLTKNLGKAKYVSQDYLTLLDALTERLGEPQTISMHAWTTMPRMLEQDVGIKPKPHNVSPSISLSFDNDSQSYVYEFQPGYTEHEFTIQNCRNFVSKLVKTRIPLSFHYEKEDRPSFSTRTKDHYWFTGEITGENFVKFITQNEISFLPLKLEFDAVTIKINTARDGRGIEVEVEDRLPTKQGLYLAELITEKIPRVWVQYKYRFLKIDINPSWDNNIGWVQHPPVFMGLKERQEITTSKAEIKNLIEQIIEIDEQLGDNNEAGAKELLRQYTEKVKELSWIDGTFLEIKDGRAVEKECGYCVFCGETSKLLFEIPVTMGVLRIPICTSDECKTKAQKRQEEWLSFKNYSTSTTGVLQQLSKAFKNARNPIKRFARLFENQIIYIRHKLSLFKS